MRKTTINCDACDKDLGAESYTNGYYLRLTEHMYKTGSVVAANMFSHHIPDDMFFCNLKCLKEWLNK